MQKNFAKVLVVTWPSIESLNDKQKVVNVAEDKQVWLGGHEVDGHWQWSNGEKMTSKLWQGTYGDQPLLLNYAVWGFVQRGL